MAACKDKDKIDKQSNKIDRCIYEIMDVYYLWNTKLPHYEENEDRYPEDFFESLLYTREDSWSFCVSDGTEYLAESYGTPYSMGYSPQFWAYNDSKNVLIIVECVYPGSPAERAGLKRGDIILDIDGVALTPDNYYDLYSKKSATYELGGFNAEAKELYLDGRKLSMQAEVVEADPSVYDTIFNVGGKPVGYFVYMAFTSDTAYFATIDAAFDRFKAAGVKDLILDLRYNRGGDIDAAGYLASAIAPANVVSNQDVLIRNEFNSILTREFRKSAPEELEYKFPKNEHNADIENLYVLGTDRTASASELVTVGLMPYMNVKLIGEPTYGKCTGMFVFHGSEKGFEDLDDWALLPVCMKYANANGYTDFVKGLQPDYKVKDDLLAGYQFGDANDPMIATALSVIQGLPLTAKAARVNPFTVLDHHHSVFGNNLIIKPKMVSGLSKE